MFNNRRIIWVYLGNWTIQKVRLSADRSVVGTPGENWPRQLHRLRRRVHVIVDAPHPGSVTVKGQHLLPFIDPAESRMRSQLKAESLIGSDRRDPSRESGSTYVARERDSRVK